MKKVFCDRHPDRPAVATFKIREVPAGYRPMMIPSWSWESDVRMIDLCDECAQLVRPLDVSKSKQEKQ